MSMYKNRRDSRNENEESRDKRQSSSFCILRDSFCTCKILTACFGARSAGQRHIRKKKSSSLTALPYQDILTPIGLTQIACFDLNVDSAVEAIPKEK
jgi:hypothetical protein